MTQSMMKSEKKRYEQAIGTIARQHCVIMMQKNIKICWRIIVSGTNHSPLIIL